MEYVTLNNGIKMPVLGYGVYQVTNDECELKEIIDGSKYIGRIVNVSVDESVLGEEGKIDLGKFHPIIFDGTTAGYYAFGDRVGNAFKDGAQLK